MTDAPTDTRSEELKIADRTVTAGYAPPVQRPSTDELSATLVSV